MKIRTKLIYTFGVVTLMTLSVSMFGFLQTRKLSSALYEIAVVRLPSIEGLQQIKAAMVDLNSLGAARLNFPETAAEIAVREKEALVRLQKGRELYEPLPQTKEESAKWQAFVVALNQWRTWQGPETLAKGKSLSTALRLLDDVISINAEIVKAEKLRTVASFEDSTRIQRTMLAASGLALAVAIGVGVSLARGITRPLTAITRSLAKIGQGDLQTRIEPTSNDELGEVAKATNRLAEELSMSEARLKSLSDNLPSDMIYQFELKPDGTSRFTYVSKGIERLHGIRAEELVDHPKAIFEQVLEEDRPQLHRARDQSLSAMTPFEAMIRVRRKDGEIRWMHLSSAPRRLPDRRVIWDGVERDVTHEKKAEEELQRRKAFLEAQVHSSPDGILVVDQTGKKILQNQRVTEMWAIPASIANDPNDETQLQFAASQVKEPAAFLKRVQHLHGHPDEIAHDEIELKDGKILDRYSAPVLDEAGNHYGRIWTFRDITQRKQTEERIQLLQNITADIAKAEDLQDAFPVVLRRLCEKTNWELSHAWLVDPDGKHLRMVAGWTCGGPELAEFSRGSKNVTLDRGVSLPGLVLETGKSVWVPDVTTHPLFPTSARRDSATRAGIKAALAVPIVSDGEVIAVLEFGMTQTRGEDSRLTELIEALATQIGLVIQRKRAEGLVRRGHRQMRALAGRLQAVREEERTRIAREIHDILAQELTRLRIDLGWVKKRVAANDLASNSAILIEKLDGVINLTDSAIVTVQNIAAELRPVVLDSLGLAAAIEWQAEEVQQRTGIQCDVIVSDEDFRLDQARETNVFRIVQESLTNVIRHAGATKVEIILEKNDDWVVLVVQDNGTGFDPSNMKDPNSLGLLGMRERALMMGGKFEISDLDGKGTQVRVEFPAEDLDGGAGSMNSNQLMP